MAFKDYSANPNLNDTLGDGTYIGPNMLRNKVRPALQQLAADGKELADRAEGLIALGKGDPGGTPQAIGLFTAASSLSIPTGVDVVATSGYSALDVGAALYVYDSEVDADYVTANPRSSFLSSEGRGFRLSDDQDLSVEAFGAIGIGGDDTIALTAFINSAIANPGTRHFLPNGMFGTTAALPNINVSSIWIEGAGTEIHDGGSGYLSGSVIKWIGASSPSATILKVEPVSDAGNQRLSNIVIKSVGFDCNSLVGQGLSLKSIQESVIDIATANASSTAVYMGVVAALSEARDCARNRIRISGRQIEAPGGYTLTLDGNAGANTCLNQFDVDAQCKNVAAIRCVNSDSNYWLFVRASLAGGGTATAGMELLGAASAGLSSRAENIEFYSSSLPIKAYGTADYTAASQGHVVQRVDVENGTPAPVAGIGATIALRNAWQSYTPTITSGAGTLTTTASKVGQYRLDDAGFVTFMATFAITTNGTGATQLRVSLPFAASAGALLTSLSGVETSGTGKALSVSLTPGGTYASITFYDGSYPGGDGRSFSVSGTYRAAF